MQYTVPPEAIQVSSYQTNDLQQEAQSTSDRQLEPGFTQEWSCIAINPACKFEGEIQ
jgi:hypothetical protein